MRDTTRKRKTYEELDFIDDFMFCKILQNNLDLCKELTELIIGKEIGEIITSESQKSIEITADGRGVRFDVYFEDDASTVYDIEMQTYHDSNLPKRFRYYQGMIDLNLIERNAKFDDLKNSYIVFICLENPFKKVGLHKYSIQNTCVEDPSIDFKDGAYKMILSAEGDKDDVSEEMKAFLQYLSTKEVHSDFTKRLNEQVITARKHDKWRLEYMTLLERDERMWEQGHQVGIEEGVKEGFKEGETLFALLINKLIEDDRREDIDHAAMDEEYRHSLYIEYHLK
ncbi:MAG: Rpn family recombination-promoting nuclease/putative transposase [Lachnospiraceae bacterium]|nr:Rpn family recombination-promoting nuclease/putative transposase [Lachnospiraceae bacterium]